jgi:hypothetical protein
MEPETKLLILSWSLDLAVFLVAIYFGYEPEIKQLWKNKRKIVEGMWNRLFPNAFVERVARQRDDICRKCDLYEPVGKKDICYLKGSPCCGYCGCKLAFKQRSLSSGCDIGKWSPVLSQEEEDSFREKHKLVND